MQAYPTGGSLERTYPASDGSDYTTTGRAGDHPRELALPGQAQVEIGISLTQSYEQQTARCMYIQVKYACPLENALETLCSVLHAGDCM